MCVWRGGRRGGGGGEGGGLVCVWTGVLCGGVSCVGIVLCGRRFVRREEGVLGGLSKNFSCIQKGLSLLTLTTSEFVSVYNDIF